MNNRLQLVHCDTLFATREEAKNYVNGDLIHINRPALYAEPMVLKYGDALNPNILLAIGSVGDGQSMSSKNKVFFIDIAEINETLDYLKGEIGTDIGDLQGLKQILENIIASSGLNEDGTFPSDTLASDDLLKETNTLLDAIKKLSLAIQTEIARAESKEKSLTIKPNSTSTVDLSSEMTEEGTNLSANVKLAPTQNINGNNWSNILLIKDDGLFVNVDVKYNDNKLIVNVNGETTEYSLPQDTKVVSGHYDRTTENIVLTLNNDQTVNIDVAELIEEWGVDEIQKSPILLKKEHVKYEEQTHDEPIWKDILSADVRIKNDNNNILEKVLISEEDGTYGLYVNGAASNIKCWVNGKQTTVQDALNNNEGQISESDNNILKVRNDGLFASVTLDYNTANNSLVFDNGNGAKTITLNETSVLVRAYYELGNLVLEFQLSDGSIKVVTIPISEILKDFQFDNTNTTVTLDRKVENGQYYMFANVNVSNDANNILEVNNHDLYVKGLASNIKYSGETTVADVLSKLDGNESTEGSIRNLVAAEAQLRQSADENLQNKINDANSKIDGEIARATAAEQLNAQAIETNKQSIQTTNAHLSELAEDYRQHKDANTQSFIEVNKSISDLTKNLTDFAVSADSRFTETLQQAKTYTDTEVAASAASLQESFNETIDSVTLAKHADNDLYYELTINGKSHGSINIPKDQFLKSVEYDDGNKQFIFTFITTDDDEVVTKVSVKDLVDEYVAGNGLSLSGNVFSIKLSPSTQLYAEVGEDGLKITGIDEKLATKADKFTTVNTNSVNLDLSSGNELKADVKLDSSKPNNIISLNDQGFYATVSLVYDNETGKLTFNNGVNEENYIIDRERNLQGGSVSGSPITVHVDKTQEDTTITATLAVSLDENNLLSANDGALFASNLASKHRGTYRSNEMTMQEALNTIASEISSISGVNPDYSTDIAELKSDVAELKSTDIQIKSDIDRLEDKIQNLSTANQIVGSETISVEDIGSGKQIKIVDNLTIDCGEY